MKIQFLGTAAAEGLPALFCTCKVCEASRKASGRAVRTRSQALIDDTLLIDFPADTYLHFLRNGIKAENLRYCLITHTHSDHLYTKDIGMIAPGFSHMDKGWRLSFYGSKGVGEKVKPALNGKITEKGLADFTEVSAFVPFTAGKYTVTPLRAIHDPDSDPLIYQISDGEKTVLYAHDTHFLHDDVWDYWKITKSFFNLVSLDCTNATKPVNYIGHMSLEDNKRVRELMQKRGYADEKTVFVCNHFSHNGSDVLYREFRPIARKAGFKVSYDGMVKEI